MPLVVDHVAALTLGAVLLALLPALGTVVGRPAPPEPFEPVETDELVSAG